MGNKHPYGAKKSQYIVLITASLMCRFKGMDIDLNLFQGGEAEDETT